MPRSDSRSSTCRSDRGKRTYIITARRITSGEVLKYRNGFFIQGRYKIRFSSSIRILLTIPIERLPLHLHASVKKALRQAWDQDDADKAERLLRNLARRLEHEEPGVSGSILEGLDEILTVIRLGLPHELRRSLACTNIIENALGTVRQVTRNVKRWRNAEMALRWTAAGLLEAQKTFRRLKAYRQLPILRNALQEHLRKAHADSAIETIMKAA